VLAVVGKQIPQFESLGILLGDEPALAPPITFYQRLLAGDVEEAADLLEEHLNTDGREATYDQLVIPALALAKRDRQQGQLDEADQTFVCQNLASWWTRILPLSLPPAGRWFAWQAVRHRIWPMNWR